jgi:hypothetical protein
MLRMMTKVFDEEYNNPQELGGEKRHQGWRMW